MLALRKFLGDILAYENLYISLSFESLLVFDSAFACIRLSS